MNSYLEAGAIFFGSFGLLWFFKSIILIRLEKLVLKTKVPWDDYVVTILKIWDYKIFIVISVYAVSNYLNLSNFINDILYKFTLAAVGFYGIRSVQAVIDYGFNHYIKIKKKQADVDLMAYFFIKKIIDVLVWIVVLLLVFQNMGFEITALIGGLGISGLAVAFAVQNLLSDIFSSFSIYLDKPFEIGDFIQVGNQGGTVKKIGIKSTRLKTLRGEELVVSNKQLTETQISNFKKMSERRAVIHLLLDYQNNVFKLEKIPDLLTHIINQEQKCDLKRVFLKELTKEGILFEAIYVVQSSQYDIYAQAQQDINFTILKELSKMKVKFASSILINSPNS